MKFGSRRRDDEGERAAKKEAEKEIGRDARRGRPDVDLKSWAEARGLEDRGGTPQAGYLRATCPWSSDLLFNVVRGRWSTGSWIVACHESRLVPADPETSGHGERTMGNGGIVSFLNPLSGGWGWIKAPTTTAAIRAPHLATLTGMQVVRQARGALDEGSVSSSWESRVLEDLPEAWIVSVRDHSDAEVAEELVAGPIRELLSGPQPPGFEIRIEYGQVILSQANFLKAHEELDALVAMTDWLATAVPPICAPTAGAQDLDISLPEPGWLAEARAEPSDEFVQAPIGARLDTLVQIADERGLSLEDPRSFHQAFPRLNVPGEAFGVFRGRLPGTELHGRLLCCAERPMDLPFEFREFLHNPGGRVGCDVAVLPIDPTSPATRPEGEVHGGIRVAVADGVLTAWRARDTWQARGPALDAFSVDVAAMFAAR